MAAAAQTFSYYPSWPAPLELSLATMPEHECVYLPGRMAQMRAFMADRLPPELYHEFMDAGFRRSGRFVYQPACRGCRQCVPLRIAVDQFFPSKSQRRSLRRNQDLGITIGEPRPSEEKHQLYA